VGHLEHHDRGSAAPSSSAGLRQRPDFITISSTTGRGYLAAAGEGDRAVRPLREPALPTGELNRFLGELKEARQPPSKAGRRLNLLYWGAGLVAAARAFPLHRERTRVLVTTRLRLLGGESAAREVQSRGGCRSRSTSGSAHERSSWSARGAWGTAVRGVCCRRAASMTCFVVGRGTIDGTRRTTKPTSWCLRWPSRAFSAKHLAHVGGKAPILSLVKGLDPESGERLSTPRARFGPVAGALAGRTWRREVAEGLAERRGDRLRGRCAGRPGLQQADHFPGLSRLRPARPDRRRASARRRRNVIAPLRPAALTALASATTPRARADHAAGLVEMARPRRGRCGAEVGDVLPALRGWATLMVHVLSTRQAANRRAGEMIARGATTRGGEGSAIGQVVEGPDDPRRCLRDLSRPWSASSWPITEGVCAVARRFRRCTSWPLR